MRIVLLGAPGAGKGTQCKRIVSKYGLLHLSSGDILRQERSAGTELGRKAQGYMDSGSLVPDEIIVEMMAGAIIKASESGFVLDGFPRTVNQAAQLDKSLKLSGKKIDAVLNLKIDDKVVAKRMTGRRSCPKCGAVYHIERPDDTLEVVDNRLKIYHQQTKPVVDYYKKDGIVYDIDANSDADDVTALVIGHLDKMASLV
jgi:adenylate kinase